MDARETRGISTSGIPHLSHSRVAKYLHCPEQYRLYYVENLRRRLPQSGIVFGQVIHEVLAGFFRRGTDPVGAFARTWAQVKTIDIDYGDRDSWERCAESGTALLQKFVAEEASRLSQIEAVEEGFSLTVTSLGVPLVGVVDLVAHLDEKRTVIDFKTAAKAYEEHSVTLSDQLTAYALARPEADEVALCVLIKTKVPRIEWHRARRTPEQVTEYLRKTDIVAQAIAAGHFYRRPGWWCSGCDYLPVCVGDEAEAQRRLIMARPR